MFQVGGGSVKVNNSATVVQPDVMASNGVIHVIDTVLMPPAAQAAGAGAGAGTMPAQLPRAGEADVVDTTPIMAGGLALLLIGGMALMWRPVVSRSRRG
jgi:hypothetical protein